MFTKERLYAGIFGGIVGDALGVPYEFRLRYEMNKYPVYTMRGYGTYNQPLGTWSDDSSLTLATMDSLTKGINYDDMMIKFCNWLFHDEYTPYSEVFDVGITTRIA